MLKLFLLAILPLMAYSQLCFNSQYCTAGQCCRATDGRIINAGGDFWTNYAAGNVGQCTAAIGSEGDACDSNCRCGTGLLCAPNVLCRTCGNICMAQDVVNRLVQYYNIGCNCAARPTTAPKPSCRPFSSTYKEPLDIQDGVVVIPGF